MKRIHKDCPFSREEIDFFHAVLYNVNTTHQCCNAAPVLWVAGWQRFDAQRKRYARQKKKNE